MDSEHMLRIILDVIILVCVIFGWWYIALPLGLIASWALPYYIELVAFGFIYDSLYGMGRGLGLLGFMGIIITVILFFFMWFFKVIVK